MRKLHYSAFIAFWASIATILAIHMLGNRNDSAAPDDKTYTLAEVAEHASKDDCWMAIEGKVYDLTDYIGKHPTRPGTIIAWCGLEATEGMRTKGKGSDHSSFAWKQLEAYAIGTLKAG